MNWKKWKIGLAVAAFTGLLTTFAVGAVVPSMTTKEAIFIALGLIAKDLLLFLKDHPVESVTDLATSNRTTTTSNQV